MELRDIWLAVVVGFIIGAGWMFLSLKWDVWFSKSDGKCPICRTLLKKRNR